MDGIERRKEYERRVRELRMYCLRLLLKKNVHYRYIAGVFNLNPQTVYIWIRQGKHNCK